MCFKVRSWHCNDTLPWRAVPTPALDFSATSAVKELLRLLFPCMPEHRCSPLLVRVGARHNKGSFWTCLLPCAGCFQDVVLGQRQPERNIPTPPPQKKKKILSNRRLHQRVPRFLHVSGIARNEQLSWRPYAEAGWTPDPYSEGQPTSGLRTFLCNYEPLRASTPEPQSVDDLWGLKNPQDTHRPSTTIPRSGTLRKRSRAWSTFLSRRAVKSGSRKLKGS